MIYEPHSYLDDGWYLDSGGGWSGPGSVGLGRLPLDGGSPFTPMACHCPMPDAFQNYICGCSPETPSPAAPVPGGPAPAAAGPEPATGDFVVSKETLLIAAGVALLLVVLK